MDFAIEIATDGSAGGEMTFEKAEDIMNNIYLSLMVRRGSWFQNPDFGSRLHLLTRAKNTAQTQALAEDYYREALQWLIDCGRATKIEVYTERNPSENLYRLKVQVTVTQADGNEVTFETFQEVA
jgi:phage gp46-like protein